MRDSAVAVCCKRVAVLDNVLRALQSAAIHQIWMIFTSPKSGNAGGGKCMPQQRKPMHHHKECVHQGKNCLGESEEHKNHPAIPCDMLQHAETRCNTLYYTASHCNTLQRTATLWNTMQNTATHCTTLHQNATYQQSNQHTATHSKTLQHNVTHCNTMQHTAIIHGITLKSTIRGISNCFNCLLRVMVRGPPCHILYISVLQCVSVLQ